MPRASPRRMSRRRAPRATPSRRRAVRTTSSGAGVRTMKECREVIDLLTEYLEGGLLPAEASRLETHLAGCDGCAGFLESLKSVRAAARTPKAEAVPENCRRALRSFLKKNRILPG